jgi:EAL domain-containing protein (putative c-di-GMP-specific phosphodiesterase class I)
VVRAVESLVRWRHPERGLVMPGGFIGIAEECGLAQPLGEWTLHEACVQSRRWQAAGIAPVPVAVNLSARVFRERSFVTTLRSILGETRLDPTLLELEITESAVMQQSDATSATLEELSAMGIKLAVDDFGTGIRPRLPQAVSIDKLKIDPLVHAWHPGERGRHRGTRDDRLARAPRRLRVVAARASRLTRSSVS